MTTTPRATGINRLSAAAARAFAKPANAGKKLSDGGGLYLTVTPGGAASWRLKYRFGGAERLIALGLYPAVGLAEAREARDAAKKLLREGKDPVVERRLERATQGVASDTTFARVASQWFDTKRPGWSAVHADKSWAAFERDVFPRIGALPIATITAPVVSGLMQKIAARGVVETASRILEHMRGVFRYAMAIGVYPSNLENPAAAAAAVLPARRASVPRPALLTVEALRDVMRRAELAPLSPAVRMAHRLTAFSVQRIQNIVEADWAQFSLDDETTGPTWTIPRSRMKVRGRTFDHVVLLGSTIATELRAWRRITGDTGALFPSPTGNGRITKEAIDKAYSRTLELSGTHSPHGWRASFSTLAHDAGCFQHDAIELCLDHVHDSEVARAYDRGERRAERARLARWWDEQLTGTTSE